MPKGKGDQPCTKSGAPGNEGSSNYNATETPQEGACPAVTPPHHTPSALSQNNLLGVEICAIELSEENDTWKIFMENTYLCNRG